VQQNFFPQNKAETLFTSHVYYYISMRAYSKALMHVTQIMYDAYRSVALLFYSFILYCSFILKIPTLLFYSIYILAVTMFT